MKKALHRISFGLMLIALIFLGSLLSDRAALQHGLVRLHVVANSDSAQDQSVKLAVRDEILEYLNRAIPDTSTAAEALEALNAQLPKIEAIANQVLSRLGFPQRAKVSLCQEAFPIRDYDTFRLPSGIYQSLRVTIGEGQGHNWWCVVYPALCNAGTTQEVSAQAGDALPVSLTNAITQKPGTQLRFYLLDRLGSWDNRRFLR